MSASRGATLNLPLPRGTGWASYKPALEGALDAGARYGARLLVVSLGADLYAGDPISHFTFAQDDFAALGGRLTATGATIVTVLEGGYATASLEDNISAFVAALRNKE